MGHFWLTILCLISIAADCSQLCVQTTKIVDYVFFSKFVWNSIFLNMSYSWWVAFQIPFIEKMVFEKKNSAFYSSRSSIQYKWLNISAWISSCRYFDLIYLKIFIQFQSLKTYTRADSVGCFQSAFKKQLFVNSHNFNYCCLPLCKSMRL